MCIGIGSDRGLEIMICFILSFMILCFCKYLSNIYYVLGVMLDIENIIVNKI